MRVIGESLFGAVLEGLGRVSLMPSKRIFLPPSVREKSRDQFYQLKQLNTPVAEFEAAFTSLSRFALELVASEERRCLEFKKKLRTGLKLRVARSMTREHGRLVDAAVHLEIIMHEEEDRMRGFKRSQDDQEDGRRHRGSNIQQSHENELLVERNTQLENKVNELQQSLNSAHTEKEATFVMYHMNTITELTNQHSKASELNLEAEARVSENKIKLHETIQKFSQRDLEAKDLIAKLNELQGWIKMYEEQAHETIGVTKNQKVEFEQTLFKLKGLEGIIEELQNMSGQFEKQRVQLAGVNSKLTQDLATYESKLNDLNHLSSQN
ncbi:paramyosin-like [Camellia sinensis]|uniref:paramyosin-like n=1 Tax=Camellia sinensis TaxID=4442 RepID=UPI0010362A8C|nr:paramyosin-like [Camellia sinensis]